MPTPRQHKENHILYADAVGSTCKSGVWFTESDSFKGQQRAVLEAVKEKIDWVAVENVVMAVSLDPPGIALIAPNPSLPGVIVLADGATPASTEELRAHYVEVVREATQEAGVPVEA
ncbi:hypothetical protein AB0I46_30825 [Streptomyces spectabilis]|uniref:hypothetical protein n=1 Tax=Streptomyces spectabilis TaxID=68270 RepID=UPI0033D511CD